MYEYVHTVHFVQFIIQTNKCTTYIYIYIYIYIYEHPCMFQCTCIIFSQSYPSTVLKVQK